MSAIWGVCWLIWDQVRILENSFIFIILIVHVILNYARVGHSSSWVSINRWRSTVVRRPWSVDRGLSTDRPRLSENGQSIGAKTLKARRPWSSMVDSLVDCDWLWSTVFDYGRLWSTVVEHGWPLSSEIECGRLWSTMVDNDRPWSSIANLLIKLPKHLSWGKNLLRFGVFFQNFALLHHFEEIPKRSASLPLL